ncbi:hypothetical protein [Amycolatopsis thermoflava]|uniref:hypothetical protein n=1 Tax=Amycolatopsis thermoflava TaxID=84480 RepID=UPI0012FA4FD2|nr:hypothetical protein [Amycolatopsis thermoflava]
MTIRGHDGFRPATRVLTGVPDKNDVDLREADGALRVMLRSAHGPWLYRLDTLNLAYRAGPDPEIFLGTPTRRVDERAALR